MRIDAPMPELMAGQVWRPRGQGMIRRIVDCDPRPSGAVAVRFQTKHGAFETSASDFRFWIDRLSAALD